MNGRRRDLTEWSWTEADAPQPGDYGKQPDGTWYGWTPIGQLAGLDKHTVVEHEDGTITVSPSILCGAGMGDAWHGYLERGVWREV